MSDDAADAVFAGRVLAARRDARAHRAASDLVHGRICGACASGLSLATTPCARCGDTRRVDPVADPAEAWEALVAADVLPRDAAAHPARRFASELGPRCLPHCAPRPGGGARHSYRCPHFGEFDPATQRDTHARASLAHPATGHGVVVFAGAWGAVVTAEALARELCARLAPWGCPQPPSVLWRVVDVRTWEWTPPAALLDARRDLSGTGLATGREQEDRLFVALRARQRFVVSTAGWIASFAAAATAWDAMLADGDVFRRRPSGDRLGPRPPGGLQWRVRDLGNPFGALRDIWATGAALEAIDPDAVTLALPELT